MSPESITENRPIFFPIEYVAMWPRKKKGEQSKAEQPELKGRFLGLLRL
jgi:hypothetical protein